MTTSTPRARALRVGAVVALGIAAVATLAGCSGSSSKAPETVYSGWVSGGTISSVRYDLVTDGATKTYTNTLSRATWSLSLDAGAKPSVTVTPSPGGTAHCVVSAPGSKTVLVTRTGAAGAAVTCSATS